MSPDSTLLDNAEAARNNICKAFVSIGQQALEWLSSKGTEINNSNREDNNRVISALMAIMRRVIVLGERSILTSVNEMVKVPSGSFQMDSQTVTVSSFSMSKYDVMQGEWIAVMGKNPSGCNAMNNPVENVSWYDTIVYCNKRSIKEGLTPVYSIRGSSDPSAWGAVPTSGNPIWDAITADWSASGYRLPTEMEWMWAAMGGDPNGYTKAFAGSTGANNINDYAWTDNNAGGTTHPVGTKTANELGLYDMSGNVDQWCWDWYGNYPSGSLVDYRGAASGKEVHSGAVSGRRRVLLGCNYLNAPSAAKVASRGGQFTHLKYYNMGFRVVRP